MNSTLVAPSDTVIDDNGISDDVCRCRFSVLSGNREWLEAECCCGYGPVGGDNDEATVSILKTVGKEGTGVLRVNAFKDTLHLIPQIDSEITLSWGIQG